MAALLMQRRRAAKGMQKEGWEGKKKKKNKNQSVTRSSMLEKIEKKGMSELGLILSCMRAEGIFLLLIITNFPWILIQIQID